MTTIATDHLLHHEGRVVPWITRWTNERQGQPVAYGRIAPTGVWGATYADVIPDNRDGRDILWQREGISRGGQPQWAHVNTFRQRAAMHKRLCQVCGQRITERPTSWLVPAPLLNFDWGDPLTMSAPTCEACIPIAMDMCPHLGDSDARLMLGKVLDYELAGVYGSAFVTPDDTPELIGQCLYLYGESSVPPQAVIAQQQVVRWTKFTVSEVTR